jgi:hypothetical protein
MYHRKSSLLDFWRPTYLPALGALLLAVLTCDTARGDEMTFHFRPPDSLTFTVEIKTEKIRWVDSTKEPTDSSVQVVRRTIKRSGNSYTMTSQPISIVTKNNGRLITSPISALMMSMKATSQLDSTGMVTSVSGYEQMPAKIDSAVAGVAVARLKEVLSPENLQAREQVDWNSKIQGLDGQPVNIGELKYETATYPLPGGSHIPFLVGIRVDDTVRLDGKLCALLFISADSDPNAIAKRLNQPPSEIALQFPLRDEAGMAVIKAGSHYFSETRVVLEIATLLPRSESTQRDILVYGEVGKQARKMRLTDSETRLYTYR